MNQGAQTNSPFVNYARLETNRLPWPEYIADYVAGDERECWDKQIRRPKYWAVCTGPVSRPEEPVRRRGFQGFRYTEGLW